LLNQHYRDMLGRKSVIRELSEYAGRRAAEVGAENVYDFTLGNPSVPAPDSFRDSCIRELMTHDPVQLHGYSPSLGIPEVNEKVAASLNRRFGMHYTAGHIFTATGAAGALAHALRAVTKPGDRVLVPAPYFPEYGPYIEGTGAQMQAVPARFEDFQINLEKMAGMLTADVAAVLINSPNNPSGAVYSEETLRQLAQLLEDGQKKFGHAIFLISDEPYREIVFDGKTVPYTAHFYNNTITCYSFSKSLSIPGERIGYVAVNPACEDAELIVPVCGQISRGIGHNCPSSLIMRAMADNADCTADLHVYETNMNLLYDTFRKLGFDVVRPGGTFYIMPRALEKDSVSFCRKAMAHDLIFVPADGFGAPGWFRVAYCLPTGKVERSLGVIENFVKTEYGK
jgi:aspartate aminotransferase